MKSACLKRLLNGPFSRGNRHAFHVQPMVSRPCEGDAALVQIRRDLQRCEEHCVALHGIVAQRASIEGNKIPLTSRLQKSCQRQETWKYEGS